jgi:hypothetical protein
MDNIGFAAAVVMYGAMAAIPLILLTALFVTRRDKSKNHISIKPVMTVLAVVVLAFTIAVSV